MNVLFLVLGVIIGTAVAWGLNKLLAGNIEDKNHRIGLKATAYIVCIILSMLFVAIGSLRIILDTFIENRIAFIETKLVALFPNSNIMETNIDTSNITSVIDELQQAVNGIDTSSDNYFERLVFDAFLNKLTGYIYTAEKSVNTIAAMSDKNGLVTIKSILFNLKEMALQTISPYFVFGQIGILIVLVIYIAIYAGIVAFLKKGGAMYNKSIVFGDIDYDNAGEKSKNRD
jgi:hypothetical protein